MRSPRPQLRAVEAVATALPLFLLLFAAVYYLLERSTPESFSESLSRTDALYFTMTVFSAVGFGDISPRSEPARLLATGQMTGRPRAARCGGPVPGRRGPGGHAAAAADDARWWERRLVRHAVTKPAGPHHRGQRRAPQSMDEVPARCLRHLRGDDYWACQGGPGSLGTVSAEGASTHSRARPVSGVVAIRVR
ncbi:potassium channel family protein [Kitasatospora sp. NPDC050543]|uniref:potassium channel family protein n=1 Tax=Kitasatospora sp. NPDC050543 TaxID=3364054 RepID=UPI00379A42CD